ncbi:MAG: hypothetical protein JJU22_08865 [Gammaproteobacteria bacterium]|nr:hypothetical protein [Gammaproteobacteria bacterium]
MRPSFCRVLRRLAWVMILLSTALGAGVAQGQANPFATSAGPRTEFDASMALELRSFPRRGELGQDRLQPSAAVEFTLRRDFNGGADSVTLTPFYRFDQRDDHRRRGDLREAFYSHLGSGFEFHAGLRRVFWGQTESKRLVDVLNQVDLVENVDEEDRLGQPMLSLTLLRDWGVLEAYLLPGFRERTFASADGRLSGPFAIDEARGGIRRVARGRVDWALRYSHLIGEVELGLSWFEGTNREPDFAVVGPVEAGVPIRLRPEYGAMSQFGLDAALIRGDWAFKLEALRRGGDAPSHAAFVVGFERTLVGAMGRADLGLLLEYLYDDRGRRTPLLSYANDVFAGLRIGFNDLADSELLAGVIVDHRSGRQVWSLEGSTRIGRHWRLAATARAFAGVSALPAGNLEALLEPGRQWGALVREDYFELELTRFF